MGGSRKTLILTFSIILKALNPLNLMYKTTQTTLYTAYIISTYLVHEKLCVQYITKSSHIQLLKVPPTSPQEISSSHIKLPKLQITTQ